MYENIRVPPWGAQSDQPLMFSQGGSSDFPLIHVCVMAEIWPLGPGLYNIRDN